MRRWLWVATGLVVKLGALLAAKAILILSVAAISLSLSVASFAIPAVGSAIWGVAEFLTGAAPVVSSPRETRRLRAENARLRGQNDELAQRNRRAVQAARVQRVDTRRLTADNRRLLGSNAGLRNQISGMRAAASRGARRIGQRAVRTTTRSVAAIPVESVPIIGVSTILATTAWEIRDVCRTLDDMAEIQRALGDTPETGFAERACDMAPLWRERGAHYGDMTVSECRAEAENSRDRVFELAGQARDEVPDLVVTAENFDEEIAQAAEAEREAVLDICDCIEDLDCDPAGLAAR